MSNRSRSGNRGRPSAFRFATSAERRAMQEGNPIPFHVVGSGGGHPAVVVSGMHMPRAPRAFAPTAAGAVHTGFHFAPAAAGTPFAGLAGPMAAAPVPMAAAAMAPAANRRAANRRTAKRSRSRSRNRTGKKGKKSPSPEL